MIGNQYVLLFFKNDISQSWRQHLGNKKKLQAKKEDALKDERKVEMFS